MLQTVSRIGPVFDLLIRERRHVGVAEVASEMGVSRTRAHQLLTSMAEIGLLQAQGRGRFGVGKKIRDLGDALVCTADLHRAALPVMQRVNELTGETTQLVVLERGRALCIESLSGTHAVHVESAGIGTSVDLHCTSVGKVFLAFRDRVAARRLLSATRLRHYTRRTITDPVLLDRELERIRLLGVAYDREETVEHVHCVASPVLEEGDDVVAALGFSVPTSRFLQNGADLVPMIKEAARAITTRMGAKPAARK